MEERLISPKTGKLAKEKGFYTETTNIYEWVNGYEIVPQSLLQTWLRETHYLHVDCQPDYGNTWWYQIHNFKKEDDYVLYYGDVVATNKLPYGEFFSYEEALEEGLYQALLLIKT